MFAFTKLMQAMVASGTVSDPQFYLTTLLLNTSSTNGAQNNTFLDSSTNNFTITRNGNTTQGTFTPFSQTGWGNYFDGSSYLTAPNAAWMAFGTNDFTIECFANFQVINAAKVIVSNNYNAGTGGGGWALILRGDIGALSFSVNSNVTYTKTWTPNVNQWYHLAVSRSGTNLRLFVDGTQIGTTSTSSDSITAGSTLVIANNLGGTPLPISGYISNLRINNTALYTSNFTVSTTPLTAVSGTQILTCQSNRFVDNSSNAATLTTGGTPSVQAFSPFAPTAAYDATVVGGSAYLDGTGDYLKATATAIGSGNFTIECWVYVTSLGVDRQFIQMDVASTSTNVALSMNGAGNTVRFLIRNDATTTNLDISSSVALVANTWYHIAGVANSTTGTLYVNGSSTSGATGTITGTRSGTGTQFRLGVNTDDVSRFMIGYISSPRIVIGTAVYTANFTPPTAPLTAISGTSILLLATNVGIYDSASKNVLETVGNAQVSTTQAKWGNSSLYCGGTSDWFVLPSNNNVTALGTGDFTVEFWVRFSSFYNYITILSSTRGANGFNCGTQAAAQLVWYANGGERVRGTTALSTNTWYHIAFVRYNGTLKGYINGVQDGTTYADTTNYSTPIIRVGNLDGGGEAFTGYLDDIRITKGYARYTANFTAPTAAFPLQ